MFGGERKEYNKIVKRYNDYCKLYAPPKELLHLKSFIGGLRTSLSTTTHQHSGNPATKSGFRQQNSNSITIVCSCVSERFLNNVKIVAGISKNKERCAFRRISQSKS